MENFDLKKYLAEGRLVKENITQFEEYIDGMFNASVDQEAEEGFQTGVWAKEEEGNPELYNETEKFDALVGYISDIGGKATLEGNPDINLKLKDEGDIEWSADVTLDENKLNKLEEQFNPEVMRAVDNFIKAMAKRYGYEEKDAVFAIQAALKQRESDQKYK